MTALPTRTLSIRNGAEEVTARPATEADWPRIVEMHCLAPDMPWARPPEEMTPRERTDYGGWWMSIETLTDMYTEYAERSSPILVAESASGQIVANIDLWLADEPEPVGRNAFVEIVQEHPEYVGSGLENAMLMYAADVARALDYPALDGSFGIGGLDNDYYAKRRLGFHIWDEHDRVEITCQAAKSPELRTPLLAARPRAGVVVLGRWAPSDFIWLVRGDDPVYRHEATIRGQRCLMQASDNVGLRGTPEPGQVLDVTLYAPGDHRHDAALIGEAAPELLAFGHEKGFTEFHTWIPSAVTEQITAPAIRRASYAGTCLRMKL